jgi:hypothetical protein
MTTIVLQANEPLTKDDCIAIARGAPISIPDAGTTGFFLAVSEREVDVSALQFPDSPSKTPKNCAIALNALKRTNADIAGGAVNLLDKQVRALVISSALSAAANALLYPHTVSSMPAADREYVHAVVDAILPPPSK